MWVDIRGVLTFNHYLKQHLELAANAYQGVSIFLQVYVCVKSWVLPDRI